MTKVITEIINGETYQYYLLGKHVVRAVGVCGGRPTLKYTRIEIAGALDLAPHEFMWRRTDWSGGILGKSSRR